MEAGIEHLSRATTKGSDVMLIVTEPYYRSLETAVRVQKMAAELDIPNIYVVANKVRSEREATTLETFCRERGLNIIATIPYDENVAESSLIPQAPLDFCPDSVGITAVKELVATLKAMNNIVNEQ
jgi:CO dehydrogenase maturation factor